MTKFLGKRCDLVHKHNKPDPHTKATFAALVDAIIPSTPELTAQYGPNMTVGGVNLGIDEFVIWELDHSLSIQMYLDLTSVPLSTPIASMLDVVATTLIASGQSKHTRHAPSFPGGGSFAALSRKNRIRTLSLLEQIDVDLGTLPTPFTNQARLVISSIDVLNRYVIFGFYSEWSAYETT